MFSSRKFIRNAAEYPSDFSPALVRVLSARNISPDVIKKRLSNLINSEFLTSVNDAAEMILESVITSEKIVIVGDYDADGATSTALLMDYLLSLGANVEFLIPNRQAHGYGLSLSFFYDYVLRSSPKLIITVDNGIRSAEAINEAKKEGIKVVITDHHLPAKLLPNADVIVNPNVSGDVSLSNLAGVGVVFYLVTALRRLVNERNVVSIKTVNIVDYLSLVAIGTLADCVKLDENNRILVSVGLARMRAGYASQGLLAMINVTGKDMSSVTSKDIRFYLAPLLNSAGRVGEMSLGVECLLTNQPELASQYALDLTSLNRKRKSLENTARVEAYRVVDEINCPSDNLGICLCGEDWHEGVTGIVASKLVDKYKKPALVFTHSKAGLKGSARSIKGTNLVDVFAALDCQLEGAVLQYGGHELAAGISIKPESFEKVKEVFEKLTADSHSEPFLDCDGALSLDELSVDFAEFIESIEVWGEGNPEPVFLNTFEVKNVKLVGDNHAKCILVEQDSQMVIEAMAFSEFENWSEKRGTCQQVAYRLNVNEWRGTKKLQLLIVAAEEVKIQSNFFENNSW